MDPFIISSSIPDSALISSHETVLDVRSSSNTSLPIRSQTPVSEHPTAIAQSSAIHGSESTLSLRASACPVNSEPPISYVADYYTARDPLSLGPKRKSEDEIKKSTINGSMAVNIVLFVLQLYAAINTGSISLFATMSDSFMDLLSTAILLFAGKAANVKNILQYPTGKSRVETAGIIVFSSLMATVSIQLIVEAIKTLVTKEENVKVNFIPILFIIIALAAKAILSIYCWTQRKFQAARILAQDHRNDLVINSFGLVMSLLGANLVWWIDPLGAILIALLILRSWTNTAYEQIKLIVGKSADPGFLQRATYIALTHHPKVLQVDTCRAYHAGANLFVEVDIVMDRETPLWESHDIGENLQIKLEKLANVERAFVHVDYETSHKPEHQKEE
ncbi:4378_t:CDS:2 [Cetraspora pellucida]|uniref:4378_t:CDS:1 n=1 Tax=Cetraspora pellucida TaxID=1433469 RepID=A0ACA9L2D7_9GLOM|nr:4378_t:CDS:2 [Cetraspora pellucida]